MNQTLYANGKAMEALIALVLCDTTILGLSFMLIFEVPFLSIPSLGVVGTAIAIVGGRVVYFTMLSMFIHRRLDLKFKFHL